MFISFVKFYHASLHSLLCFNFMIFTMKKIGFLFLFLCSISSAFSQDIHFTQFFNSPLNLNPSSTGNIPGNVRVAVNHRSQWNSVGTPYLTSSFSADAKKMEARSGKSFTGVGVSVLNDKSGEGDLKFLQPMIYASLHKYLGKTNSHLVSFGMNAGLFHKSIDFSKLTFPSQFEDGDFNTSIPSGENEHDFRITRFDMGTGLNYGYQDKNGIRFNAGISAAHLTRPNQSMLGMQNRIAPRITFHSSLVLPLAKDLFLLPNILLMKQNKSQEKVIGASIGKVFSAKTEEKITATCGAFNRWKDALIIYSSVEYGKWNLGFSYDINISNLHPASHSRGAYEISVIYTDRVMSGKNSVPKIIPCIRL